jgi:hypothetical protein
MVGDSLEDTRTVQANWIPGSLKRAPSVLIGGNFYIVRGAYPWGAEITDYDLGNGIAKLQELASTLPFYVPDARNGQFAVTGFLATAFTYGANRFNAIEIDFQVQALVNISVEDAYILLDYLDFGDEGDIFAFTPDPEALEAVIPYGRSGPYYEEGEEEEERKHNWPLYAGLGAMAAGGVILLGRDNVGKTLGGAMMSGAVILAAIEATRD